MSFEQPSGARAQPMLAMALVTAARAATTPSAREERGRLRIEERVAGLVDGSVEAIMRGGARRMASMAPMRGHDAAFMLTRGDGAPRERGSLDRRRFDVPTETRLRGTSTRPTRRGPGSRRVDALAVQRLPAYVLAEERSRQRFDLATPRSATPTIAHGPDRLIGKNPYDFVGAPGGIRTPDPQIRSLTLYPAELQARVGRG